MERSSQRTLSSWVDRSQLIWTDWRVRVVTGQKLGIASCMDFVIGLDLGHRNIPMAERWIHRAVAPQSVNSSLVVCTHPMSRPYPHVAISVVGQGLADFHWHGASLPTDEEFACGAPPHEHEHLTATAAVAAHDHAQRRSGRAVVYPGVAGLTGTLRVEDIVLTSAIERVAIFDGSPLGSTDAPLDAKVTTRDYVRPHWSCGLLTLVVIPTPGGDLVPFEAPH